MKFIVDAQLPERLKDWLVANGIDALHTNDLPKKHLTPDKEIIELAESQKRIVISKDSDFYKFNLINGVPEKLLFLTTGNIINADLIKLFENNFEEIKKLFEKGNKIIELSNSSILVHS